MAQAAQCAEDDCIIEGALVSEGRLHCLNAYHDISSSVEPAGVLACIRDVCPP